MDRPVTQTDKGIEYVSPQYIVDSVNNLYLLPTKPYTPGQVSLTVINLSLACASPFESVCRQRIWRLYSWSLTRDQYSGWSCNCRYRRSWK